MIDFSAFQFEEKSVLHVVHPVTGIPLTTEAGEAVTITFHGEDSDLYDRITKDAKAKSAEDAFKNPDEYTAWVLSRLASDFKNITLNGKEVTDMQDAYNFFKRMKFLRQQADAFIHSRRNFIKASVEA